jgi:endonuclease YncB( thermonuclease family)
VLTTDPTQDRLDRFRRLLAYVDRAGTDVGLEMVRAGHAKVFVFERPFARLAVYQNAQNEAATADRGAWGACGAKLPYPCTASRRRTRVAQRIG